MKLSLLFPPLLANHSQPHGCASFRLKQLQGSYPNRPAGQQTDAQARKQADKPSPGQEASEQTRKQAGHAGRTARRQATGEQTSRTRNKPTGKSPQEGVYLVLPKAARVSADPGVCLTNQHTGKSPPKKNVAVPKGSPSIRRPRNLPRKPACREVPPKKNRNTPKSSPSLRRPRGSPSIRRPRGLPQRPAYRQVPKQKKEPLPKGSPNIRRPRSLPQRPTYRKVQKKAKERCPKRKQEPTKASQSIHRPRRDSDPAGAAAPGGSP